MPRKDPMTGVPVLTTEEFFDKEAKREGKGRSGSEVMIDTFKQIDDERKKEERELKNPKAALKLFQQEIKEWNEYDPEQAIENVKEIVEVLDVSLKYKGFSTTYLDVKALAIGETGRRGIVRLSSYSFSGTYWNPPDEETEVYWEGE